MENEIRLGLGDRIAIAGFVGGFAGTVAAMALPLAYPDMPVWVWRLIFWPSLTLLVGAVAYLIFDLLMRPKGFALKPPLPWQKAIIAVLVVSGVLWFDYWYYSNVLNAPAVLVATETLPAPPASRPTPPPAKPRLASTYKKMILVCDSPKPAKTMSKKEKQAEWDKYADLMEKIFGYSVKSRVGDDEVTFSITLKPEAEAAFPIQGQTYLIKRAGDKLFVSITNEVDNVFGIFFALAAVDSEEATAKQVIEKVEQLVHVEPGKCKFV